MEERKGKIEDMEKELKTLEKECKKEKDTKAKEKLQKKVIQLKTRIGKAEVEVQMREKLASVALSTSRVNYIDPRITVAWCQRNNFPVEKIFPKTLRAKFRWAMDEADEDWKF